MINIFIGRKDELHMIKKMLFDPTGAKHVWPIVGVGGVGKTWLFREIYQTYENDPEVLMIRLDFAEARHQNLSQLMWSVVEQLDVGQEQQIALRGKMARLQQIADIEFNIEKVEAEEEQIYDFFVRLVSEASRERRILILNDTAESIQSAKFGQQLSQVTSLIPNAVMLFAARPYSNVQKMYRNAQKIYIENYWVVHDVHQLQPFSDGETRRYFNEFLPAEMDATLHEKIHFLTDGNPVLVAIAGEWLKRNVELPKGVNLSFQELQKLKPSELKNVRERFERELIENVQTLRQPIDWATLYLAYLNRRYDPKILQLVLKDELSLDEIEEIVEQLKTLVFVRQSISREGGGLLHDEAQELIKKHAWPVADPDGGLRRDLAQTVITNYYESEIERLNEIVRVEVAQGVEQKLVAPEHRTLPPIPTQDFLKLELQIESLDYHFRLSEDQGWDYLDKLTAEAEDYHYSYIQMDAIEQAIYNLRLDKLYPVRSQMRMARILRLKKDARLALQQAQAAIKGVEMDAAERALGLIVLGKSETDLAQKLRHYQAAFDKARIANNPLLEAEALRLLGVTYRKQGKWPQAANAYRQVLRLIDQKEEPSQYAATLNNLAFVTMLSGNPSRADSLAERGLRIRKKQSNRHGLALSYATKGRIAETIGDNAKAVRHHRMAVGLAQSVADSKLVALCQANVASAERRAHNFKSARQLLVEGLIHSNARARARAFHEVAKIDRDEAEVLQRDNASEKVILDQYSSATQHAQQALTLAREIGDEHQEATILLDLAHLTCITEQREDKAHLEQLQQILNNRTYTLEKGRLEELRGDLAHIKADYFTAFSHYLEACQILAGYSPASFRETFERVRAKYWDADIDVQTEVGHLIQEKFASVPATSPLIALKDLYVDDFDDF